MSATLSPCGLYRYRLERKVAQTGPVYAFIGVNPSTADAEHNDATIRKLIGFTRAYNGSRFIVGNVIPFRATDVKELRTVAIPTRVWLKNIEHLIAMTKDADILVPCWGRREKVPKHLNTDFLEVLNILKQSEKPVMSFGLTKSGDPKHPLMLGYSTQLSRFPLLLPDA